MSTKKMNPTVRIIDRGECPKLTPRGQGILSYEFGVGDDASCPFGKPAYLAGIVCARMWWNSF